MIRLMYRFSSGRATIRINWHALKANFGKGITGQKSAPACQARKQAS